MSWEAELLNLYEKNSSRVGIVEYKLYKSKKEGEPDTRIPYVLLPPYHTTVTAQITVEIDEDGSFRNAYPLSKEENFTIIPVTEKSGSRTAGKAPHPLCDNLQYLAGDYGKYAPGKAESASECFQLYMDALEEWHLSEYTHKKVDAIYTYFCKKRLIQDLLGAKVLSLNEAGQLDETQKIQNVEPGKALVRFVVREKNFGEMTEDRCWLDRSLQESFIRYYRSMEGVRGLDYLTGEMQVPSNLHSKKIRNEGDGAKLISSNDETNFTFRGRFQTKEQAFSIGGESSQKIHSALKWIVRKQGTNFDTLTMVTWESDMLPVKAWNADTETVVHDSQEEELPEVSFEDEVKLESEPVKADENVITAKQFYDALNGYRKKVHNTSRMVLMAFDAATTGRLALAEYKALDTGRYLDNISEWHMRCGWMQQKFRDKKRVSYYGVPGVKDVTEILYGTEINGMLSIPDKNGKKLYAAVSLRLLPCIWDGQNIPYDMVMTAVNKASNPQGYKERFNWERVLTLACSFVKKHRYERNKEEWDVALDNACKDRNYLYGRLLAVADRIEYRTFDRERDAGRSTNAKRYMSTFAQRPYTTWKVIEENLQPYLMKLKISERKYYENLLDEICQLFDWEEFSKNEKLDGLYLLGFHSQSYDLKTYKKEEE